MKRITVQVRIKPSENPSFVVNNRKIICHNREYEFNEVHNNATQAHIYSSMQPLIEKYKAGNNCTIFAYGQTGSGKTYTLGMGDQIEDGIIQNFIMDIFSAGEDVEEIETTFIEIYNDEIYDLLGEIRAPLPLREKEGQIYIPGVIGRRCKTYGEAIGLLRTGLATRTVKSTKKNQSSSRSHAIFTISQPGRRITFCDLAGSERLKNDDSQISETICINSNAFIVQRYQRSQS